MLFLMLTALAQAADTPPDPQACSTYLGRVIAPTTIDAAILKLGKAPRLKDEYETTEHFTARQEAARSWANAPLMVATPLDHKYVHYDADAGMLRVGLYAIDNLSVDYSDVFGSGTRFDGAVPYARFANYDIVVDEHEVVTGSYVGTNAFGARGKIKRVTRITKAVFERASGLETVDLFIADPEHDKAIASIPMPPEQAQKLKPVLTAAVVISPRWPYVATGIKNWGPGTLEAPEEVTQHISVVVADINCALLLDGSHKVVAAFSGN